MMYDSYSSPPTLGCHPERSAAESKDLVTSKKISRFTRNDYCLIVTEITDNGFHHQLLHAETISLISATI